jgi:hypothetical protein
MATRITVEIDDGLDEKEKEALKLLLRDALNEFVSARLMTQKYMDARYPAPTFNEQFRADKAREVEWRVNLAAKLKRFTDIKAEKFL